MKASTMQVLPLLLGMTACSFNSASQLDLEAAKDTNRQLTEQLTALEQTIESYRLEEAERQRLADQEAAASRQRETDELKAKMGQAGDYISNLRSHIAKQDGEIQKLKTDLQTVMLENERLRSSRPVVVQQKSSGLAGPTYHGRAKGSFGTQGHAQGSSR